MKKFFAILSVFALLAAFCACAPAEGENSPLSENSISKNDSGSKSGEESEPLKETEKTEPDAADGKTAEEELADFLSILEAAGDLVKLDFIFAAVSDENGKPVPNLACYTKYEWSEYPYEKCSGISMQSGLLPIHIYKEDKKLDEITFILANTSPAGEPITQEFTLTREQVASGEIIPIEWMGETPEASLSKGGHIVTFKVEKDGEPVSGYCITASQSVYKTSAQLGVIVNEKTKYTDENGEASFALETFLTSENIADENFKIDVHVGAYAPLWWSEKYNWDMTVCLYENGKLKENITLDLNKAKEEQAAFEASLGEDESGLQ